MKAHDRLRIVFAEARQFWWAFAYVMQVHENHYTKRAGVAGIRARANAWTNAFSAVLWSKQRYGLILCTNIGFCGDLFFSS
ncbi:hypothetical protein S958_004447 [Salmonella enterica subsp. enterica]|nr:hypothetical protein [Salmonella enterica subsp. enterica serovar Epicrates]EDT2839935.1 hypothetical protein [Salmonella enterica subsp. enterica]EGI5643116.1 hypothetical protein [Salmonella enterica subsp. enterica serovar Chester]